MREVLFKKWVPSSPGMSGHYESDYTHLGLFHQFGNAYEEFESGAGNYTVAIVELADGTVVEVLPTNLKFINK